MFLADFWNKNTTPVFLSAIHSPNLSPATKSYTVNFGTYRYRGTTYAVRMIKTNKLRVALKPVDSYMREHSIEDEYRAQSIVLNNIELMLKGDFKKSSNTGTEWCNHCGNVQA